MESEKAITLQGTIKMVLPGTMFRVALPNDRLVSPYDAAKARIVYRL